MVREKCDKVTKSRGVCYQSWSYGNSVQRFSQIFAFFINIDEVSKGLGSKHLF